MKKRLLSGMLAITLVGVGVLSGGTVANAGSKTYDDYGELVGSDASQDKVPDPSVDDPAAANVLGIDVQAQVSGGGDIRYSVKVDWGNMRFEYDYGSTWNPQTHQYERGTTNKPEGGWNQNLVDGDNNKITVTNDSNYPVNVDFAYENADTNPFNETETTTSVKGMFAKNNDDLITELNKSVINTKTLPAAPRLVLNTTPGALQSGDIYYYQGTDDGIISQDVFFTLIGTPDRGIELSSMQSVGTIRVKITPASGATKAVR